MAQEDTQDIINNLMQLLNNSGNNSQNQPPQRQQRRPAASAYRFGIHRQHTFVAFSFELCYSGTSERMWKFLTPFFLALFSSLVLLWTMFPSPTWHFVFRFFVFKDYVIKAKDLAKTRNKVLPLNNIALNSFFISIVHTKCVFLATCPVCIKEFK